MSASMTMQDIAAKIGDVLRPYSKGSRVGLDTRDRLQRVLKQTQPIATTDLRPLSTEQDPTENGDAPSQPPPREDPVRLKLSPSWQVSLCCSVVLASIGSCTQDFVRCVLPGSTSRVVLPSIAAPALFVAVRVCIGCEARNSLCPHVSMSLNRPAGQCAISAHEVK